MGRVPPAWSFSSLDLFTTCPRKYYEERIAKSVVDEETEAKTKGTWVHLQFENRIRDKTPLPDSLADHEMFMREIEARPGVTTVERKVGLTRELKPCEFFASDVWWRGIIDVHQQAPDGTVRVIDYKTGKPHQKMRQLHLFSLYCFLEGAPMVESMFYWTKTLDRTRIKLPRTQAGPILSNLVPDLKGYVEAFKLDIWTPQQNGLCKNYCGVTECEFHGSARTRR